MSDSETVLTTRLVHMLQASPDVMAVLRGVRSAGLPDWLMFSGAVYQTVWNARSGRPCGFGLRDYDIAYFDADTSVDAELAMVARVRAVLPPRLQPAVEIANQARVHLWFEAQFGRPYPPLASTDAGLLRSLATAHAVGVRLETDGTIFVAAPFGLQDVFDLVMRPNPRLGRLSAFTEKAADAQQRWPDVRIL